MSQLKYLGKVPGVYTKFFPTLPVREIAESEIVFGMQGISDRGPTQPVLVDANNFRTIYGNESVNGDLVYHLNQFFLNASVDAVIYGSRVYNTTAGPNDGEKSTISLPDVGAFNLIRVDAKTVGTWGDKLRAVVTQITTTRFSDTILSVDATLKIIETTNFFTSAQLRVGDRVLLGVSEYKDIVSIDYASKKFTISTTTTAVATNTILYQGLKIDVFDDNVDTLNPAETWDDLSRNPNSARFHERVINDTKFPASFGSNLITTTDLELLLTLTLPVAATYPLAGGNNGLTGLTDAHWTDAATHSRWDGFDIQLLCAPENHSTVVIKSFLTYIRGRQDIALYAFSPDPTDVSAADIKDWVQNTLQVNDRYAVCYAPDIFVSDPIGIGLNPTRKISIVSSVLGVYNRFDVNPSKRFWNVPAGWDNAGIDSILNGIINLNFPTGLVDIDSYQAVLHPIGVNICRTISGRNVINGARAMTTEEGFLFVNAIRTYVAIAKSLEKNTIWVPHKLNNPKLWLNIENFITNYLQALQNQGAFKGDSNGQGFFAKCDKSTQKFDKKGEVNAVYGVAVDVPGEFFLLNYTNSAIPV